MNANDPFAQFKAFEKRMRAIRNGKLPGKLFNDPPKKAGAPKPKKLYAREFG